MRNNLFSTLAVLTLSLASCYSGSLKNENAYTFDKFPEEKEIGSEKNIKINNPDVDGLLLYHDSILLLRSVANFSPYHFSLLHLSNPSSAKPLLPTNRKAGGSLAFLSYGITGNYLWVNDIIKNKMISGNIDSVMRDTSYVFKEKPMSSFYYSVQMMNTDQVIGTGDYDSDYKISLYDLNKDQPSEQLLPYAVDSLHPVARGEKTAYESFLFLKPGTNNKCVLASRYADRIEIFDVPTRQSRVVRGPENYTPNLSLAMGNDGKQISIRNGETRYAFVKGKVTEKYIYLLYSGNNHQSKFLNHGKYIYVYDWDGKPVRKLVMKDHIVDFAVSSDDKTLYSYHPKSKSVQIASL